MPGWAYNKRIKCNARNARGLYGHQRIVLNTVQGAAAFQEQKAAVRPRIFFVLEAGDPSLPCQ